MKTTIQIDTATHIRNRQLEETEKLIDTIWRHHKSGGVYRVVGASVIEATNTAAVRYQSNADGFDWVRPFDDFMDGRFERLD